MPSNSRIVCFVFARGGSKGILGKNTKLLAGKPLIAHSIELARSLPQVETVIVSTDDPSIADVARETGAEVPFMRPIELAADTSPEWLAWQHAVNWFIANRGNFDVFLSLPPTSPFRAKDDVDNCLSALMSDTNTDITITVHPASRSPYFNMVSLDHYGTANLVIPTSDGINRRQDSPHIYDITTVAYAARPDFILNANGIFDGTVRAVQVPVERALDIDTLYDFRLAQALAVIQSHLDD